MRPIVQLTLPLWLCALMATQCTPSGQVDKSQPDPQSFAESWLKRMQERTRAAGLVRGEEAESYT